MFEDSWKKKEKAGTLQVPNQSRLADAIALGPSQPSHLANVLAQRTVQPNPSRVVYATVKAWDQYRRNHVLAKPVKSGCCNCYRRFAASHLADALVLGLCFKTVWKGVWIEWRIFVKPGNQYRPRYVAGCLVRSIMLRKLVEKTPRASQTWIQATSEHTLIHNFGPQIVPEPQPSL